MAFFKYFFATTILLFAGLAHSQDAKELSDLRADIALRTQSISQANQSLAKQNEKISGFSDDMAEAEKTLIAAKAEALALRKVYEADASSANRRDLDRADAAVVLAERKISSIQRRLEFAENKKSEAEQAITENLAAISSNKRRQDRLLAEITEKRNAEKASKADESARIKALAEAKKEEMKRTTLSQLEEAKRLKEASEAEAKAKAAQIAPEDGAEVEYAKSVVGEINAYIAGGVRSLGEYPVVRLYSSIDGKILLEHIGGEIYLGEAALTSGEHRLTVNNNQYKTAISKEDDNTLFKFYFDNRSPSQKKLHRFKADFLK